MPETCLITAIHLLFCIIDIMMIYIIFHAVFNRRSESNRIIFGFILAVLLIYSINSFLPSQLNLSAAFLLYLANGAFFVCLTNHSHILEKLQNPKLFTGGEKPETDNFEQIDEINRHYQRLIHDSHSYNSTIRILAQHNQNSKIIALIDELEENVLQATDTIRYSTSTVFNTILTERAARCEQQKIRFHIFVEPNVNMEFIRMSDMISMFGNLLDNAVEAAGKCCEERRLIETKLYMANEHMIVFLVINNYQERPERLGTGYKTTKSDKLRHGYGLGITERLSQNYGGSLTIKSQRGQFLAILTLSTQDKSQRSNQ